MKDLFGKALLDYQNGNYTEDIMTSTSISEDDVLKISEAFKNAGADIINVSTGKKGDQ